MAQQVSIVGSLAVGQTLIILTAGIDLSIGASMVLVLARHGQAGARPRRARFLALLIGVVVAIVRGAVNGLLVTRIKLPPFIVTLGTLGIFTAISLLYAQGQTIALPDNNFLLWTGKRHAFGNLP